MPGKQPVLIMIQGPGPGAVYPLPDNRVTQIGRSSRNSVRIVSPLVSRFHCEIMWVNGRWVLSDLNSKQGTFINAERVTGKVPLTLGNLVRVGNAVFRFDIIDDVPGGAEALLAIWEAEMDQKLVRRDRVRSSLQDIRARTRLESMEARRRREEHVSRHANALFLGVVFVVVAVGALAAQAYMRLGGRSSVRFMRIYAEARRAYDEGLAAGHEGRPREAYAALNRVAIAVPGTTLGANAATLASRAAWQALDAACAASVGHAAEGHYADALAGVDALLDVGPPDDVRALAEEHRADLVRLAEAAARGLARNVDSLLAAGREDEAVRLLERAQERLGLPHVTDSIAERLAELQG